MKWLLALPVLAVLSATTTAEVFDLGDLKQYDPKVDKLPNGIRDDSIYITKVDNGVNIILGKSINKQVDGVIKDCDDINDKCFQTVTNILKDAHIQTDDELAARQLVAAAAVADFLQTASKIVAALSALYIAIVGAGGKQMENGSHWNDFAASNVAKLPEAGPVTVSADGTAIATVTQTPVQTVLEGSIIPIVTVVSNTGDDFEQGDLAAVLDPDLAHRIGEYMRRTKKCKAGMDFDDKHPNNKRDAGTYGEALCAAQSVMQGATANGPFNDLVLLDPASVHFDFTKAAGAARDAASELIDFVAAYAPLIALPEHLIDEVSVYVLALAIDVIVENVPLGQRNRIKATMVTTMESPSGTSTACPKPESLACGIGEGEDCSMKIVGTGNKKKAVCGEGKHKDCECQGAPLLYVNWADKERQQFLLAIEEAFSKERPDKAAECTGKDKKRTSSPIPPSIFKKTHNHFCEKWSKGQEVSMTVDSKGQNIDPEPQLSRRLKVDGSTYRDWLFDFSFKPSEGNKECSRGCNEAFDHMADACGRSAVDFLFPPLSRFPPIQSRSLMTAEGSLDVECGRFTYKIRKQEPPKAVELKKFEQYCYKPSQFEPLKGSGVNELQVNKWAMYACLVGGLPYQPIIKGKKETFINWKGNKDGIPYQYNVWWKDGCTLVDNEATEVYAYHPYLEEGPDQCSDTLLGNWKNCKAGGVGGKVQIGCLIYEFKADDNLRTCWPKTRPVASSFSG